jgi:hypothetical protein
MNDTSAALAVLTGLAMRLLIPILVTALVVFFLSKLDRRWQVEGKTAPLKVEKPQCWKTKHCPSVGRQDCAGYKSSLPCWQAFRLDNGYMDERCLACPVLIRAPVPAQS